MPPYAPRPKKWISFIDYNVDRAPEDPAAYMLANASGRIIYIGHTQNLKEALRIHKTGATGNFALQNSAKHYTFLLCEEPAKEWEKVMDWYKKQHGDVPDFNRLSANKPNI